MSTCRLIVSTLLAGILISPVLAQNPPVPVPPVRGGGTHPPQQNHPRKEPCWQVAGISKSAMEQVRTVRQQSRQELEAVCTNSSLSAQQKRQQMREIRQKEKQQVEALISPQQQESIRTCQEQRGNGGGHVGGAGHTSGPCGEMPGPKEPKPEPERED